MAEIIFKWSLGETDKGILYVLLYLTSLFTVSFLLVKLLTLVATRDLKKIKEKQNLTSESDIDEFIKSKRV